MVRPFASSVIALALLVGCTTAPLSPALPSTSPEPTASLATLSPAPSPAASTSPTPPPTLPASITWTEIGSLDVGTGWIRGVSSIDAGYVAWGYLQMGEGDDSGSFATWFSPDGVAWNRTIHSVPIAPCVGWSERPNLDNFYDGPTDAKTIVLLGSVLDSPTRSACDQMQLVALVSTDGETWSRSTSFGDGFPEHAWASPNGWEALAGDGSIWRSQGGKTWQRVAVVQDIPGSTRFIVGGASPTGTRLGARDDALLASDDAIAWRQVATLPAGFYVVDIVAPVSDGSPWVVTIEDGFQDARVLASTDLVTWDSATLSRTGITTILPSNMGWIAIGHRLQNLGGCGDSCPPVDPAVYWSADGRIWSQVESAIPDEWEADPRGSGHGNIVDGPAGLLAVEHRPHQERISVWRLTSP